MRRWILWQLLVVLFLACIATSAGAATISGSVTNASGKTGRIYVLLANAYDQSLAGFGTSISSAGTYTISGVRDGYYRVKAFLDAGNPPRGVADVTSPLGASDVFTVTGGNVTVPSFTLNNMAPSTNPPKAPANLKVHPADGFALVEWEGNFNYGTDLQGVEEAASYELAYGPSGSPPTFVSVPTRGGAGYNYIVPLPNGTPYMVGVAAVGANGAKVGVSQSVTANASTGTYQISGTITFNGVTPPGGTSLYVSAYRVTDKKNFLIKIDNPAVTQPFTIMVDKGTYEVSAVYDQNNDHTAYVGDINNFQNGVHVTVSNANVTVPPMVLTKADGQYNVTTYTDTNAYYVMLSFRPQEKLVANVLLKAKPAVGLVDTSISYDTWGNLMYSIEGPKPILGDAYSATVTFVDGTTQDVTLTVTGVIDAEPVLHYPEGTISGPSKQNPLFSWGITGVPQGDVQYIVSLHDMGITNGDSTIWSMVVPADQFSVQYDLAMSKTGQLLSTVGLGYEWEVHVVDRNGNAAGKSLNFNVAADNLGPAVGNTGLSSTAGLPGSTLTITGTGFVAGNTTANQVTFPGNVPAAVTNATATQLTVTVPNGASTGPVKVTTNSLYMLKTTVTPQVFEPRLSYDFFVTQAATGCTSDIGFPNSCPPASLITAAINFYPSGSNSTVTGTNGNFKLTNIPAGKQFNLRFTGGGKDPVGSSRSMLFKNYSSNGSFVMYTPSQVSGWGTTTGKGAVRTMVVDKSGATLADVEVRAFSTRNGALAQVKYTDPNNTSGPPAVGTGKTGTDGKFWVLDLEPGDTVVVSAVKSGYVFSMRTFDIAADTVNEGKITGSPVPTITGFTTSLPGENITITGTNFDPVKTNNIVTFSYGKGASVVGATATQLVVTVPLDVNPGPITVALAGVRGAIARSSASFVVPGPSIAGFSPTSGATGTTVTISGSNFSSNPVSNTVRFGTMYADVVQASATQLQVTVPYGATTGKISVETAGGSVTSASDFTVVSLPNPASLSPDTGASGIDVTISGTYYDLNKANYQVKVGSQSATVKSVSGSALVFVLPTGNDYQLPVQILYAGQTIDAGLFNYRYRLTLDIPGGGGTVNNIGDITAPFSCASSICFGSFDYCKGLNLHASPSAGYEFNGWSGAGCTGTGDCGAIMCGDQNVTASFSALKYVKIGTAYYPKLQDALSAVLNGESILVLGQDFVENVVFSNAVAAKVRGGFAADFLAYSGVTKVDGTLKIRNGTLRVDKLAVK